MSAKRLFATIVLGCIVLAPRMLRAADRISLDHATIVTDADNTSYVQYSIEDLAGYLKEAIGAAPQVANAVPADAKVVIAIGSTIGKQILGDAFPDEKLGAEGYCLKSLSKDGKEFIVITGVQPQGTMLGLMAFMKAIAVEGKSAVVPQFDIRSKPVFAKRGMHFNGWPFNEPYSFRSWSEQDWDNYIDILAYQGVNLFYLWPFIEIMPVPLSPEDQAYLEECRRVVDYAQKKRGMTVWLMQCTNRVASDRLGVADPKKRPYWRPQQKDLNPGDPKDFQAIMDSRAAMYKIINNADGVCNIDADPGECPGSPISDFVKVMVGYRQLLDRYNIHGKNTDLRDWMWTGWGMRPETFFDAKHQHETMLALKAALPEPWGLVSGQYSFLGATRAEHLMGKTVMLRYGLIEGEPAYPATLVDLTDLRRNFKEIFPHYPDLEGIMGNEETPLLQFPHFYYFTNCTLSADYSTRPLEQVLGDLAGLLYPDHQQLIADAYAALDKPDTAADTEAAEAIEKQLEPLIAQNNLGRLGLFGRKLFPDHRFVAQSLLLQLRKKTARERLDQITANPIDPTACEKLLQDDLDAYLAWDTAHGWHNLWGWDDWLDDSFPATADGLARTLTTPAAVDRCFDQVGVAMAEKYKDVPVKAEMIPPMKAAVMRSLSNLAPKARATASQNPDPKQYPASAAIDGDFATRYWPGALVKENSEWIQLTWDQPQSIRSVVVSFVQHPSMPGRTIHLQKETSPGKWEDFATAIIPKSRRVPYAVATFQLPAAVSLDKIRIVNLLDIVELEVQ